MFQERWAQSKSPKICKYPWEDLTSTLPEWEIRLYLFQTMETVRTEPCPVLCGSFMALNHSFLFEGIFESWKSHLQSWNWNTLNTLSLFMFEKSPDGGYTWHCVATEIPFSRATNCSHSKTKITFVRYSNSLYLSNLIKYKDYWSYFTEKQTDFKQQSLYLHL